MAPKICVLGSANMDLVATVPRIPHVGETVVGHDFASIPGGKGANQALAAARAGAQVRMLGAVGDDAFGRRVRQLLDAETVDVADLSIVDAPTGTAHIVVDDAGDNQIVVVAGANGTLTSLNDRHREVIAASDTLLVQLELPLAVVAEAVEWAHAAGVRTVLTPAPVMELSGDLLSQVDLLVPNQHEAASLTGIEDPVRAAHQLRSCGCRAVVVTLGAEGCVHVDATGLVEVPGLPVAAIDTTAAGDTFVGCLAVALAEARPIRQALRWATVGAALSVQRRGASSSMPTRALIDETARRTREFE